MDGAQVNRTGKHKVIDFQCCQSRKMKVLEEKLGSIGLMINRLYFCSLPTQDVHKTSLLKNNPMFPIMQVDLTYYFTLGLERAKAS